MHAQEICISNRFANLEKILKLGFWKYLSEIFRRKLCFFQNLCKERFCIK